MSHPRDPSRDGSVFWRARLVAPGVSPPVKNGVVVTRAGRVAEVIPWKQARPGVSDHVVDLGDVAIFPGLVNAHCHLDYTHMAGKLPPLGRFTDWLKAIVALKAEWSYTEFAASWLEGARSLVCSGTTTVADTESVPELVPEVWGATPLRVFSFRELIHFRDAPAAADVAEATVREWETQSGHCEGVGLSPHAPYSTSSGLLQQAARKARARGWRLSTHVAESEEEFQMFRYGHGALYEWLRKQRTMNDCGHDSPVSYLARIGYLGPDLLAAHVNYLDRHDASLLARHGCHVAHCPRSHAYFQHLRFPLEELVQAGVNVCLGTDSLASVRVDKETPVRLSLLDELRQLAMTRPGLDPAQIVRMATVHGARALGRAGELGELSPGALADMITIPSSERVRDALERLVGGTEKVLATILGGRQVYPAQTQ